MRGGREGGREGGKESRVRSLFGVQRHFSSVQLEAPVVRLLRFHAQTPVAHMPLLQVLRVAGCFWNQPELFGGLRQLTVLTELR